MDVDSEADAAYPTIMSTTEMLNTFDTDMDPHMHDPDSFFHAALACDTSNQLFSAHATPKARLQSSDAGKMSPLQASTSSIHTRHPVSTSPGSSLPDFCSDSSLDSKRKDSSKSSQSDLSTVESPLPSAIASDHSRRSSTAIKHESLTQVVAGSSPVLQAYEFFDGNVGQNYHFSNEVPFSGPRHVAIRHQDSPVSTTSLPLNQNHTPEASISDFSNPGMTPSTNKLLRPNPLRARGDYLDNDIFSGMEQRSWPFGSDASNVSPGQLGMTVQCMNPSSHQKELAADATNGSSASMQPRLVVDRTPPKSRVETQIPIKMTLYPMPKGVTKLHLPSHTISKPKLQVKPPPLPSPDTLQLHTMLVCTSAMQDSMKQERAKLKAREAHVQGGEIEQRLSIAEDESGEEDDDDDERPLNGGDVRICNGCMTRERKRAARKKSKKPEEEEAWLRDEARRIIVFNTNEIKEWQPVHRSHRADSHQQPSRSLRGPEGHDHPAGAMQIEVPMRIACYCRHHNEKSGYQ